MYKYNPRKTKPEDLEKTLVGADRWDIVNTIIAELSLKEGDRPKQHWMIIGPRGIGKSHLLTLVYHRVKSDPDLSKTWIPVLFPEEIRMAGDLAKFIERGINEIIYDLKKEEPALTNDLQQKIESARNISFNDRADYLLDVLKSISTNTGKHIIFFAENLQQILGKRLNAIDQKKLRAFLQESDALLLIGSATTIFEALHDHSHPFYHFFHLRRLQDLSYEEVKDLVIDLVSKDASQLQVEAVLANEPRLRAIYTFTGGNPRMAVFLADILKSDINDEMIDIMEQILDELTPYFDAIINDTPQYLQDIMNCLATFEPAQSPKEIAEHLEMEQATVRNYLKQAKDIGYVRIAFHKGNSNYYCLNEYLYRIWYQMRDSSHKEEIRWVFEMLLMLYSRSGINNEIERYKSCSDLKSEQLYILNQVNCFIENNQDYCKMITDRLDLIATETSDDQNIVLKEARHARNNNNIDDAIKLFLDIIERDPANIIAHGELGDCYSQLDKYELAIIEYQKVIDLDPSMARGWSAIGECYLVTNDFKGALYYFSKASELSPNSAKILVNWGNALKELHNYDDAIVKYQEAIKINSNYAGAFWEWGDLLRSQKKYKEAMPRFKKAAELNPKSSSAYGAWGDCLAGLKKYDAAIDKYRIAIELNNDYYFAYLAWARVLRIKKQYREAIDKYEAALKYVNNSSAVFGIAMCLVDLELYKDAENIITDYLADNPNDYQGVLNLVHIFECSGKYADAILLAQKVLNADYKLDDTIYLLTNSLNKAKRYEECITVYNNNKEALSTCKNRFAYATALFESNKYKEAITQFTQLLNSNSNCAKARLSLAQTQVKNNSNDAIFNYISYLLMKGDGVADIEIAKIYIDEIKPLLAHYSNPKLRKNANVTTKIESLILSKQYPKIIDEIEEIKAGESHRCLRETMAILKIFIWFGLFDKDIDSVSKLSEIFFKVYHSYDGKNKNTELKSLLVSAYLFFVAKQVDESIIGSLVSIFTKLHHIPQVYIDVWTCLSAPDSIQAQKLLTLREIKEIVSEIKTRTEIKNEAI